MNTDNIILNGIHIGEHEFVPEKIIDEIKTRCIDAGFNYAVLRPHGANISGEDFCKWAKYLADNEIYFMFLYTVITDSTNEKRSLLTRDTVKKIKELAGKYFLGDVLGEPGSSYTIKADGYFIPSHPRKPIQGVTDMGEAARNYTEYVSEFCEADKNLGINDIACVESTLLTYYNLKAGVTIPILEVMPGNPEILISGLRGAAKAANSKLWGTYIAQEWYGGKHHEDILKQKRLELAYKYAYMAGSNIFCLESGDEQIDSFGYFYDYNHEYCRQYREVVGDFNKFIKSDKRPSGGPKIKIAFVYGNNDGWGAGLQSSCVWGQFNNSEWGSGDAEHSWRILEDIVRPAEWYDTANFGSADFSGKIPYGMYDIVPADSDISIFSNYEYLIFAGYNTMTEKLYNTLEEYVSNGGNVFMTAAHLNTNSRRNGEMKVIYDGNIEKLFGCRVNGSFVSSDGFKFAPKSEIDGVLYAGPKDYRKDGCDPFYSMGYANYADVSLCGAKAAAVLDNCFAPVEKEYKTAIVENKIGSGCAALLTALEYPGNASIYTLYKTVVSAMLSACHAQCDIKIYGSEKLKYAVYGESTVYLLNTDFDCKVCAHIIKDETEQCVEISPGELVKIVL